jgi:tungstate transport system substrate-binding protein
VVSRIAAALAAVIVAAMLGAFPVTAGDRFITIASTTSTDNSGLFAHLLPIFTASTGINIRVVALGTGQAIRLAQNGDADVLLVHHQPSEEKFIADGFGLERRDVMYNDFIIVGPAEDPAGIRGINNVAKALAAIAQSQSLFISRGDDSGTHKAELRLWQIAAVDVNEVSGSWYLDAGSGMGTTLNIAAASSAYSLSDQATWIAFRNKGKLVVHVENDTLLFNQYGVIAVNPWRHPHVKSEDAQRFVEWLTSAKGQAAINAFTIDGRQLFFANHSNGSS